MECIGHTSYGATMQHIYTLTHGLDQCLHKWEGVGTFDENRSIIATLDSFNLLTNGTVMEVFKISVILTPSAVKDPRPDGSGALYLNILGLLKPLKHL